MWMHACKVKSNSIIPLVERCDSTEIGFFSGKGCFGRGKKMNKMGFFLRSSNKRKAATSSNEVEQIMYKNNNLLVKAKFDTL